MSDELLVKRFIDLSKQAARKGIVMFSDFLTLSEQQVLQMHKEKYDTDIQLFGGYDLAERQMVAFIPDALYYDWNYPFHW